MNIAWKIDIGEIILGVGAIICVVLLAKMVNNQNKPDNGEKKTETK